MVDAAIEAYAADRDVNEFLDTLHILANHSKEELEDMMRQSDADGDSQCEYHDFELNILWLNIDCFFYLFIQPIIANRTRLHFPFRRQYWNRSWAS